MTQTTFATVADLLADPGRWCQGAYALDATEDRVDPEEPTACRWCVSGAIEAVYHNGWKVADARVKLRKAIGDTTAMIPAWNDARGRTHAEVIEAVRRAGI